MVDMIKYPFTVPVLGATMAETHFSGINMKKIHPIVRRLASEGLFSKKASLCIDGYQDINATFSSATEMDLKVI